MKNLDFIIIGAQKSGTTSLFKYLDPHPKVFMPANKEAPFFTNKEYFEGGWDKFASEFFKGATDDQFWGTASPQYMSDASTAKKIHEKMPDARLIALLRNPVDRAYSHYTMQVRRVLDDRSFDDAVAESIKDESLNNARNTMPVLEEGNTYEDESGHYLVWGEYGRILDEYLKYFPKEQLLVVFMDEMINDPPGIYKQVTEFIGVGDDYVPENVGEVYHKGGSKQIIPQGFRDFIKNNILFKMFWNLVPETTKQNVRYWYDQKNVQKSAKSEGPSEQSIDMMIKHFEADIKRLEEIAGRKVPWKEFG